MSNFGATLVSCHLPDYEGKLADVVLGFDTVQEYDWDRFLSPYVGC